jgi:hypothetical protein
MRFQNHRTVRRAGTLLLILTSVNSGSLVRANALPKRSTETAPAVTNVAVVAGIAVNETNATIASAADIELIRAGQPTSSGLEIGTSLNTGDIIRTKENDRLVLRFLSPTSPADGFVYLDPNTEVEIGSLCIRSGRLLVAIGWNFEVCFSNRTVAVKGTEFDVAVTKQGELEVAVLTGKVEITSNASTKAAALAKRVAETYSNQLVATPVIVENQKAVTISADDKVQRKDISETDGHTLIDRWTAQMIKMEAPSSAKDSAALNYPNNEARRRAFAEARFNAVWNQDPKSLETMGKVYNDWNQGGRATAVLNAAAQRDSSLLASPDFLTDLAEANRLSRKYDIATSYVQGALRADEKYSDAYYVMGRIELDRSVTSRSPADVEHARGLITKSLQAGSTQGTLNKVKAEQELDEIIQNQGKAFLANQARWVAADRWWEDKDRPVGIEYSGTTDIPELKKLGVDVSGQARLYIIGNQFKLKTATQLLTGTIVGVTSKGYTAVALRFDDPRFSGIAPSGINLSLQNTSSFGRLVLEPTRRPDYGTSMGSTFNMQIKEPGGGGLM